MTPARAAFEADLKTKIAGTVLEPHLEKLLEQVKVHINIQLERVTAKDIPHLASRMAGAPDLPPDFEWPEFEGKPLLFLAQFNLEEVAPYDTFEMLPKTGMLSFFYYEMGTYSEDADSWRICLHPLEHLVKRALPYVPDRGIVPCRATFEATYYFSREFTDYQDKKEKALSKLHNMYPKHGITHLLGIAVDGQSDDVENVLLEIGWDESCVVEWCGAVIFCLDPGDLKEQNFDKSIVVVTCD